MSEKTLSRRDFLRGAGAATAMGLFGLSMSRPAHAEAAAVYTPGTYTGVATGLQSDVKVTITVDETSILSAVVDSSGETATIGGAAADTLAEQIMAMQSEKIDGVSGETMDWFTERLAETDRLRGFRHEVDEHRPEDNYPTYDVGHSIQFGEEYYEQLSMDILLEYAEGLGLEVRYETPMIKLCLEDGRVTGVIAKNAAGDNVRINASKGVILCAGGYAGNADMMGALQPWSVEQTCINYAKPGDKGDGIRINETMHAIREDGSQIDGLFVCGDNSGSFFNGSYPNLLAGLAAGRSATFGRLAGRIAAKS